MERGITMPGMGGFGTETISGFYPYLLLDLAIIVGIAWLSLVAQLGYHLRGHGSIPAVWADPSMPGSRPPDVPARIFLRRSLGILWIVDGLLQAQPAMPGGFAHNILAPATLGQPSWLSNLLNWESFFWQAHPLDLAVATVCIQIGLGVAILAGADSRLGKAGLWSSIVWGLGVWLGGEAMGGFVSPGTELMGAPGAVLVYVAAAALLLLPRVIWVGERAYRGIRVGVGAFFLLGAVLQAAPWHSFWTAPGLSAMFTSMASVPQPGFLSAPVLWTAHLAQVAPVPLNAFFVGVMGTLGIGLVRGRGVLRSWTLAALAWLAVTWWIGQDFGALGSKTATDPNLSPLLAMMLVCAWIGSR
ncbi:MAG TPA: hypothetical protein VMV09_04870, partial [Candidatus Saccharimonadales bacterium]|nr:hypothetical protein [Candidatus Saccharimonadales bacterium]